jgi:hypothetical protein
MVLGLTVFGTEAHIPGSEVIFGVLLLTMRPFLYAANMYTMLFPHMMTQWCTLKPSWVFEEIEVLPLTFHD